MEYYPNVILSGMIESKHLINDLYLQFYLTFMYYFTSYKALPVSHSLTCFSTYEVGKTSINKRGVGSFSLYLRFSFFLCRNMIKFYFFPFIFISWRLITLQYCSGFCHTLT